MNKKAPIAIFCYNRPKHLSRMIQSLKQCEEYKKSPIFVFADGAVDNTDKRFVENTRKIAKKMLGYKANYFFSRTNKGLANSIIFGVNKVLKKYDRIIVIEDDLILHKWFLRFMNEALYYYWSSKKVFQVSGYMYNSKNIDHKNSVLFLPFITSWGWGTWRNSWKCFDHDAKGWKSLDLSIKKQDRFNLNNTYDFSNMLKLQMLGKINSWAIRWYWSVFKKSGLTVFPPVSLVKNDGFDGSGTHGTGRLSFFKLNSNIPVIYPKFIKKAQFRRELFDQVCEVIYKYNGGVVVKFIRKLIKFIKNYI
jgi:hypothetical protein